MKTPINRKQSPVVSDGNVFADLRLDNSSELLVKADLAHAINEHIRAKSWKQSEVMDRTGLTQSDVSKIARMKTDGFSQERLQMILRYLGLDVEIRIQRRPDGELGILRVLDALRRKR